MAPSPEYFRAIFFSEDGPGPVFVWLRMKNCNEPDQACIMNFDTVPFPPRSQVHGSPQSIGDNDENRVLQRPHELISLVGFLAADANGEIRFAGRPTGSVGSIDPELVGGYKGPLLFCGMRYHLDMISFRHIVDDLRSYWYDARIEAERQIPGPIKGVRVNCLGDTVISKRPIYEPINTLHNTFFDTDRIFKIPLGENIGIPLEVHLIEPAVPWRNRRLDGDTIIPFSLNFDARILNPAQWRMITGSIMIIRKDLKPLHCAHIDALREYCLRESFSAAQLSDLPGGPPGPGEDLTPRIDIVHQASSQQLLSRASKQGFPDFFLDFMRNGGHATYGYITSPYIV